MAREYRLKNPFADDAPKYEAAESAADTDGGRPAAEPAGRQTLTVSELADRVKGLLTTGFPYGVWVEGELSDPRVWSSGHLYFTLKDDRASLKGMMWAADLQNLKFQPEQGLKVICYGKPDFYPPRGELSFKARTMEPQGRGALQLAFEQMVRRLEKEGLFAEARKKPLPAFPEKVGVVTSPTGAAIGDILKRLQGQTEVLLYPCRVQGNSAIPSIVRGIEALNAREDLDLLIVGRGGGSLEDLWAFNEEAVVRAVFDSRLPVISAVGHEKDIAITDLAADLRATTPTNAAEIVLRQRAQTLDRLRRALEEPAFTEPESWIEAWTEQLAGLEEQLLEGLEEPLLTGTHRLRVLQGELMLCSPQTFILHEAQRLQGLQERLTAGMRRRLEGLTGRLHGLAGRLHALSPLAVLERGYSITFDQRGKVLKRADQVRPGEVLETRLRRGTIRSRVEE
ncbi:MAG: exodeoxyribonuclease VII large subunit [Candidatus Omnitrophica bacterium CG11_big_fil_rev_8_21_14_0_20_64_10]|nr:MAG: exodeoxyribonuclease VII large subunit [Candidatus Omnitrophica bacterium CG11_big_fil_rev_8_21_14_0_20_64_10]